VSSPALAAAGDGPLPGLNPYAAVVLTNASGLTPADAAHLGEFVRAGGGLLVFGGDRVTAEGSRVLVQAGLIPGSIAANRLAEDLPFRIESWDESHSVFRPFADPQHGDLRRLTFRGCTPIAPAAGAVVLATFGDKTPALVEHTMGDGRILWFASTCDLDWSDWPRGALFVPLVHQMMGRLTGLNDGGPVRTMIVNDAEASTSPGVFRRSGFWQVVNLDPRESETQRCLKRDLRTRFAAPGPDDDGEIAAAATAGVDPAGPWEFRQNELWHWIVVALVGLAALEFAVGNRVAA
jgi:hypothetical protein